MIINTRKDFDALPEADQQVFRARLAGTIYGWSWVNGEWVQTTNTKTIERFGFTLDDFPDAPVPDKPTGNPDEDAKAAVLAEVEANRLLAYRDRSDPIFMKWQRGEATEQEWIDEVEAIRAEFPYPEETTG